MGDFLRTGHVQRDKAKLVSCESCGKWIQTLVENLYGKDEYVCSGKCRARLEKMDYDSGPGDY